MLYWILYYRLDQWFFLLAAFVAALYADLIVIKQHPRGSSRHWIWCSAMILVVAGIMGAALVGQNQRDRLRVSIEGLAPTYAYAMQLMGHERLTMDTSPDDPLYLAIVHRQREWLASNPAISDIYTMRRTPSGDLVFLVDSETDYDRDGRIDTEREQRTDIGEAYPDAPQSMIDAFAGVPVFDDVPTTDRWGTTVSAFTPIWTSNGELDGIVGVDFPAEDWIRTLLLSRGCVFGAASSLLIGLVVMLSVSHVQRLEIETQRHYAEKMRDQALAVEEAMRQLKSYEFVLDTHALVYVTDRTGRIIHANQRLSDLCGVECRELVGQPHRVIASQSETHSVWDEMWETVADGRVWHGEICNRARDGSQYWVDTTVVPYSDSAEQITQYITMGTDITAKKRYEAELVRAARLDRLTGLPNRSLFHERLRRAIQRSQRDENSSYAVMFLDFDRFKLINDSLGHDVGDLLLIEIARRLRAVVAMDDSVALDYVGNTVARIGGDEFVVLLASAGDEAEVLDVAKRLLKEFDEPYRLNDYNVRSTASIGIVMGNAEYRGADAILRDADTAMYAAKARGKACCVVFDTSMQLAVMERLQLESDLRDALSHGQFSLAFQPIGSLNNKLPAGVEVFMRWHHPTRGILEWNEFAVVAEETRLVVPLGTRMIEESCMRLANWLREQPEASAEYVSVNVAGPLLREPGFVERTLAAVAHAGLEPHQLQLELVEADLMRDEVGCFEVVQALKGHGIRLALDRFGAERSSLACLQRFPFDVVKIDASFTHAIGERGQRSVLVESICALVRTLGLKLVADGVTTSGQWELLQLLGCHGAQGEFVGAVLPWDQERTFASVLNADLSNEDAWGLGRSVVASVRV